MLRYPGKYSLRKKEFFWLTVQNTLDHAGEAKRPGSGSSQPHATQSQKEEINELSSLSSPSVIQDCTLGNSTTHGGQILSPQLT